MRKRTLGSEIRAGRMRFGWLSETERYIRLSGEPGRWRVEALCPSELPRGHGSRDDRGYVMWYALSPEPWPEEVAERRAFEEVLLPIVRRMLGAGLRVALVDDLGRRKREVRSKQ